MIQNIFQKNGVDIATVADADDLFLEKLYTIPVAWLEDVDVAGESKVETRASETKENASDNNKVQTVVFFNDKVNQMPTDPTEVESIGVSTIKITESQWASVPIIDLLRASSGNAIWNKDMKELFGIPSSTFFMYMTFEKRNGEWVKGTPLSDYNMTLSDYNLQFDDPTRYIIISERDPETIGARLEGIKPLPPQLRL